MQWLYAGELELSTAASTAGERHMESPVTSAKHGMDLKYVKQKHVERESLTQRIFGTLTKHSKPPSITTGGSDYHVPMHGACAVVRNANMESSPITNSTDLHTAVPVAEGASLESAPNCSWSATLDMLFLPCCVKHIPSVTSCSDKYGDWDEWECCRQHAWQHCRLPS